MKTSDVNLMLAGIAFIAASVSKHEGVAVVLYWTSAGILVGALLSILTDVVAWLRDRF
jgi:hypothetical protein